MIKDQHTHFFDNIRLIPVVADNEKYKGIGDNLPSFGTLKPMGIMVRTCKCGLEQAFDYAPRKELQAKWDVK